VAAQTLTGKGFEKIYNLTGGIKAWKKEVAVGDEEVGLNLFDGVESGEQAVIVGFGLEMGLRDFYLTMRSQAKRESTQKLFAQLADIEILHQQRLLKLHEEITGTSHTMEEFSCKVVQPAMEGGLTTDEYLQLYKTDLDSELEVLGLALAIEAQALDLYLRAAERSKEQQTIEVLQQIAQEERSHMDRLARYIDQQQGLT